MVVMPGTFRPPKKKRMICRTCLYIPENTDLFGMMRKTIIDIQIKPSISIICSSFMGPFTKCHCMYIIHLFTAT